MNPQREYKQRHPRAPMPPPEWGRMNGVRGVEYLDGGLVKYEIRVPRDTWLGRLPGIEDWHVRLMNSGGDILTDITK